MPDIDLQLPSFHCSEAWLFGGKTRLVDRGIAYVEKVRLPAVSSIEGTFKLTLNQQPIRSLGYGSKWARRVKQLMGRDQPQDLSAYDAVLDLRLQSPENWAHAFTNQLPIALMAREQLLKHHVENSVVLLPEKISSKIEKLFTACDFQVVRTNSPVYGKICQLNVAPWLGIRGTRVDTVDRCLPRAFFTNEVTPEQSLGEKVYLSRKDTRKLKNETEIWAILEKLGYRRLYLEEHSLSEQIATVTFAKDIIAVHGASLGPLILRRALNRDHFSLIEIFSPAHVTNVYRMIAEQGNGRWIGVRGRPWPGLLKENADFVNNLSDFEACPDALLAALEEKDRAAA